MVYTVTGVDRRSPRNFISALGLHHHIAIVENAWSYLSIITMKTPSNACGQCGHAVYQSGSTCGLASGATSRTRLFLDMKMVKISTAKSAMTRVRIDAMQAKTAHSKTRQAETVN